MIIDDEICHETGLEIAYGYELKSKKQNEELIFSIMLVRVVAVNCLLMFLVLPPFGMMTGVNGDCKRVNGNGLTPFVDCLHQNIPGSRILLSIQNLAGIGILVPDRVHMQCTLLGTHKA